MKTWWLRYVYYLSAIKLLGMSWEAEQPLASHEILCVRCVYYYDKWCNVFQWCAFKLVPEIVQCCPPQSEVVWRLPSDALPTVSFVYKIMIFLISLTYAFAICGFYSTLSRQLPLSFILLMCCCLVTVNSNSWHFLIGFF